MTDLNLSKNTMSSLEIAELTGKRHADVMRDIRNLLGQGVQERNFALMFRINDLANGAQRKVPYYELTKQGCLILASGYNALLREKIIERWVELEKQTNRLLNNPDTPEEIMARALVVANDTLRRQRDKIQADAPKVLFAEAVQTSKNSCLIGELSKILAQNGIQIGQIRLFKWLRSHGYLCSKGESYNQPTQKAVEMKLFEIKKTSITKPDGTVLVTSTTKVTGKGQVYFVNKFLGSPKGGSTQGIPALAQ